MKRYLFLTLLPILAVAESHGTNYDVVPRTINFLIFFGILFFLLKNPIKNAFNGRIQKIASRLEANQQKLKESVELKEQIKNDIETAKIQGVSLVETAKKEIMFAEDRLKSNTEFEIKQLNKTFEEQKDFETRKMKKEIVNEVLEDVFNEKNFSLEQNELINIIQKKAV